MASAGGSRVICQFRDSLPGHVGDRNTGDRIRQRLDWWVVRRALGDDRDTPRAVVVCVEPVGVLL